MPLAYFPHNESSAIILAAGNSNRMGEPKFALRFNKEFNFIQKIVDGYNKIGCQQIVLVINSEGYQILKKDKLVNLGKIKTLVNNLPELERFYSIKLGLNEIDPALPTFIHNCDNPFLSEEFLIKLSEKAKTNTNLNTNDNYYVPEFDGRGGHPIFLTQGIISEIRKMEKTDLNLREVLKNFTRISIPVKDEKVLININTIDEYNSVFKNY